MQVLPCVVSNWEKNIIPSTKYPGRCDVSGDVYLTSKNLTKLPLQFGVVTGYFNCSQNKLESLEGAPIEVGRSFYCSRNKLKTLEGAPKYVGGSFGCSFNELKTLEGAPIEVGKDFWCNNNQLESLEGAPIKVGGSFDCSSNKLKSLEGAPREVGGGFDCKNNKLISLEYLPNFIGANILFRFNPLNNLNHIIGKKLSYATINKVNHVHSLLKIVANTELEALEYIFYNNAINFSSKKVKKYFEYNLERIILVKRIEKELK